MASLEELSAQDRRSWESVCAGHRVPSQEPGCVSGFPLSVGSCAGNPSLEAQESRVSALALHWPTAAPRGLVWDRSLTFSSWDNFSPECVVFQTVGCVQFFATPWTVAHQDLLSMVFFPSKNTGVGCHFLLRGIFLDKGSNRCLLHWQADSFRTEPPRKPRIYIYLKIYSYVIAQVLVLVKYIGSVFILKFFKKFIVENFKLIKEVREHYYLIFIYPSPNCKDDQYVVFFTTYSITSLFWRYPRYFN